MEQQPLANLDWLQEAGGRVQARNLSSASRSLSTAQSVADEHESQSSMTLLGTSPTLCDCTLSTEMKSAAHISSVQVMKQRDSTEAGALARGFGAGLEAA